MWDLTLSRELGRVNATAKGSAAVRSREKLFLPGARIGPRLTTYLGGADLANWTGMTSIPKDSEIVAVVVLLGAVLITGLLRAFSF